MSLSLIITRRFFDRRYDTSTGRTVYALVFRIPRIFHDEDGHQHRYGGYGENTVNIE